MVDRSPPPQTKPDYTTWSKTDLIDKIRKLETHVFQLRNVITKQQGNNGEGTRKRQYEDYDIEERKITKRTKKTPRHFDFSQHSKRHIALKFLYLGWDYQGFASQEDTIETIEAYIFKALTVTRLIEERAKSNYHRCGRTDKGVSAFQQVISLDLRSKLVDGVETLDYCFMLNRVLPRNIRVLAWAPVRQDFSARFDCNQRTYKYFFPRGNLDLSKMREAAKHLRGEHDFRNLCKMDKDKTTVREIFNVDVVANEGSDSLDMCKLVIVGRSFVWHQIRCIAAVLILVGKGLEQPDVVQELLDVEKNPKKPQYSMAMDYPLVLFDVQYPKEEEIVWTYPEHSIQIVLSDLQTLYAENSIRTAMITEMMKDVEKHAQTIPTEHVDSLLMGTKRKCYQKLFDRPVCGGP